MDGITLEYLALRDQSLGGPILYQDIIMETDENDATSPLIDPSELKSPSELYLNSLLNSYPQEEEAIASSQITREQYVANRNAKTRGTANPSVMNNPFWLFQAGLHGLSGWSARETFGISEDPSADTADPVWCFKRFGATRTKLPDGRLVCIGGEHEDFYDPDFCIYNGNVIFELLVTQEIG